MSVDADARDHAVTASEMLRSVEKLEQRLRSMTDDERLQMVATGGFARTNADIEFTLKLAASHALAAIALSLTGAADA